MANYPLKKAEAASLLWEEWKYRHDLFWRSLYRWGIAAITVSIFPWINPDIIKKINYNVLIFPVLAALISLFAAWHIGSEYARLKKVTEKYRNVLGTYSPESIIDKGIIGYIIKLQIGIIVPLAFVIIALPISGLNIYLLINQLKIVMSP